jgi:hypothetical protein
MQKQLSRDYSPEIFADIKLINVNLCEFQAQLFESSLLEMAAVVYRATYLISVLGCVLRVVCAVTSDYLVEPLSVLVLDILSVIHNQVTRGCDEPRGSNWLQTDKDQWCECLERLMGGVMEANRIRDLSSVIKKLEQILRQLVYFDAECILRTESR